MNGKTSTRLKIAFVIWVLASLGGLFYFSVAKLVYFDPTNRLLDTVQSDNYSSDFTQLLTSKFGDLSGKAIHFIQDGCFCNMVAQSHISAVKNEIDLSGHSNEDYNITSLKTMRDFVPSTPAVALFNESGNLLFFGPYSTGYLCTAGNGFVEELITQMENKDQPSPITVSIARGCYCNN